MAVTTDEDGEAQRGAETQGHRARKESSATSSERVSDQLKVTQRQPTEAKYQQTRLPFVGCLPAAR